MSAKRLSGKAALDAWPERLAEVQSQPSDEALQRLCALLDAVDAWVVQRWDKPGHDDRMATFANMRAEAQEVNRLVSASIRGRQAEAGRANGARRTRERAVPSPVALPAVGAVMTAARATRAPQRA